ncbi:MAG: MBL fold metallo-hydrolase RNA specificity domain-containing protein [Candidatus Korarchaeota archaeon]
MSWLSKLRAQAYLMRSTGHHYPHELKTIISIIKPKNICFVHTQADVDFVQLT